MYCIASLNSFVSWDYVTCVVNRRRKKVCVEGGRVGEEREGEWERRGRRKGGGGEEEA